MMLSAGHRKQIDISEKAAWAAFDKLPSTAFLAPKKMYPHKNFKNAPTWQAGVKLLPYIHAILDATKGAVNVHPKSMLASCKGWLIEKEMDVDFEAYDEIVYSGRALLSQILNHKKKERIVPTQWLAKHGPIFEKVQAPSTKTRICYCRPRSAPAGGCRNRFR